MNQIGSCWFLVCENGNLLHYEPKQQEVFGYPGPELGNLTFETSIQNGGQTIKKVAKYGSHNITLYR